jgi:hypothetical protein
MSRGLLATVVPVVVLVALLLAAAARTAAAHGVGMSQLVLRIDGARIDGEWDLALADARRALGLDPQLAGDAGWRDLRAREPALRAYLGARLALNADGAPCAVELPPSAPLEWQSAPGVEVRAHLVARCPREPTHLELRCTLLFDVDAKHRAYYSVQDERVTHLGLFRDDLRTATIDVHRFELWPGFLELARAGISHIWSGLDHILFLLALLLPAPLLRTGRSWQRRAGGLGASLREVVKVVTAFTAAHSLTLCLSFFGLVTLPARVVEVGIALSVFAAAWNNLRPFLPGRAWVMAFAFGLVHGLAFAGALRNLSLPFHARGFALASFNVGVEIGQLAIVLAAMPLLWAASKRAAYPRLVLGGGSFVIAWLAVLWFLERGFGLSVLSFA